MLYVVGLRVRARFLLYSTQPAMLCVVFEEACKSRRWRTENVTHTHSKQRVVGFLVSGRRMDTIILFYLCAHRVVWNLCML